MPEPRKRAAAAPERVALVANDDGTYQAVWREVVVRFLLSDGSTVDVRTSRDDSDLRGVLLATLKVERIEGSTQLVDPS